MNRKLQSTIAEPVAIEGVGLHTGAQVKLKIQPTEANHGIVFQRVDIEGKPKIKALVDFVTNTDRGTTISVGEASVSTIEHLMASLVGTGVDNALIEIDGPEVPILDGSAIGFVQEIDKVGVQELETPREVFQLKENLSYIDEENNIELRAIPADHYSVTTMIDFNSPVLGTQHAILRNLDDFESDIAPSRTFCFLHELRMLVDNNLIKGGDVNNAIVVVDEEVSEAEMADLSDIFNKKDIKVDSTGILNNIELHYPNEAARHKLLDVVGDLALVGYPINAEIISLRPGHKSNVEFAKILRAHIKSSLKSNAPQFDADAEPIYTHEQVQNILPHRYPLLLVDKIIELGEDYVIGIKNTTGTEAFYLGHFPGNPVMPGVLQVEAMAQVGGILALTQYPDPHNYDTYFLKIDKCKFKQKVTPGDTLVIRMKFNNPIRRGMCDMHGEVYVGNNLCAEADMVAQIIKTRND